MHKLLVIHGPNLNLIGSREPEIYGYDSISVINSHIIEYAAANGLEIDIKQSNHEGQIIDWVQESVTLYHGLIINPGGLTHYSVSLLDALISVTIPVIEVHMSNLFSRELFRSSSLTARSATGFICGMGYVSYLAAVESLKILLTGK